MTTPVRPCAVLVAAFRSAATDQTRRETCLETTAAGAPNLAAALWAEHRAYELVDATKGRGKGSTLVDRHAAALAERNAATARVRNLLAALPDAGTRPLPEAATSFDPTPARSA